MFLINVSFVKCTWALASQHLMLLEIIHIIHMVDALFKPRIKSDFIVG